ncbi:uncharacterized protein LOC115626140 isoform X1 [Scaptodrosophila lebanonensis]|uniref:Uncharacterized protein LOC115626140 isoform X1 n=1 Tax=Drosophila lebanonensis TaxID=7225 RepID=A0A6J2TMI1_DROLE|nr:uncharacterized protein LOC115626140 isoform X1 [Scaptodrosophila lebanonensis]
MEHLDLAGYLHTPTTWNFGAFEQQDAIYLSNSRQMLEPIMEETSEDEEHAQNSWTQFEQQSSGGGGFWSSAESETGSVIRVEVNKDLDAVSERDFVCPPKRARRSDEQQPHSLDDVVQLRRAPRYDPDSHNSLERFLSLEASTRDSYGSQGQRNSTGSRRFDEFYSDNDSYHSLSRSSSLVQFESLERQLTLQEQHQSMSSLGNSSPSLLGSETNTPEANSGSNSGNNSRRGSQSSLMKRYESSDGRLHQTYYELNKLNFGEEERSTGASLFSACKSLASAELKSDSESSSSSSDSSGHSILSASKPTSEYLTDSSASTRGIRIAAFQARGGKNSAENLSEDSGYCEPSTLRRVKSKSIPKNFDKFCEEEEEDQQLPTLQPQCLTDGQPHSKNSNDLCQPKINANVATFLLESRVDDDDDDDDDEEHTTTTTTTTPPPQSPPSSPTSSINSPTGEKRRRGLAHSPSPALSDISNTSASSCSSTASFTWLPQSANVVMLGSSLPDIREACGSENSGKSENSTQPIAHYSPPSSPPSLAVCAPLQRCRGDVNHIGGLASNRATSSSSSSSSADCSPVLGGPRARNASVPNELHQLGRRRRQQQRQSRHSKSSSGGEAGDFSSSDDASEQADFFDLNSLQIRRSCSWSERRAERSLHKFEGAFGDGPEQASAASAGYLNASYQNLTLLDYTNKQPIAQSLEANHKRSDMAGHRESDDYEGIICRGNFLLDELSQIYDRNASILNDQPVEEKAPANEKPNPEETKANRVLAPAPPPRRVSAKAGTESQSVEPPQVQHVQLTIRKPPARQKRDAQQRRSEEVTAPPMPVAPPAAVISFSTFGKTFDQDPTNLRTSYAQSLEQCNFDPKELSSGTDVRDSACANSTPRSLPKRRFQSQAGAAKQRSLVSSTPNLYAYDARADEVEDDMYVSSAHNSMHQLPQTATQKPLGILLPTGSRTSIGKEVSFCPVVSKYCWQEQSSEEPQEEAEECQAENDDDDELFDCADATVIYNTKENENIAVRFNEEQAQRESQREPETIDSEESDDNNENIAVSNNATLCVAEKPVSSVVVVVAAAATAEQSNEAVSLETNRAASVTTTLASTPTPTPTPTLTLAQPSPTVAVEPKRPLSLHLPILSEPPTNRAHHILYASQQLLDRYATQDGDMSKSNYAVKCSEPEPSINNNELGKSRHKSDEKHPSSKGFLSRFAHGLRFSLRRKKKQQQQQQQQQKEPAKSTTTTTATSAKDNKKLNGTAAKKPQSPDFVYIPLKGPTQQEHEQHNDSNASTASVQSYRQTTTTITTTAAAAAAEQPKSSTLQKLVTGKPPLPKQPPRVAAHAQTLPPAKSSSSAAHSSEALLDAERQQYAAFAEQLTAGMQRHQLNGTANAAGSETGIASPSRATVAQKTQMFNQLGGNRRATMVTAVPVAVAPMPDEESKIGLIETNLDTHETVISGKTRSLMDITCNPGNQQHRRYIVKRLNVASAAYDDPRHIYGDDDDDDDVDGSGGDGNIKCSPQAGGVQIASMRRPHKSMEFLLDKENQKNVLPPENELQKSHDHNPAALSEHQLRVQASLQRLNIPDWFRQYNQTIAHSPDGATAAPGGGYKPGNFTRKRTQESGRWQGLNSKTTSLSSLGSQRSDRSPLLLSPSAHSHHGGQTTSVASGGGACATHGVGATRWSTSHLNSTQTSPSVSQRGSFARGAPINSSFMSVNSGNSGVLRNSYRQPYLGWRSTEKLSQRTPHERLANSLLAQQQRISPTQRTVATSASPMVTTNGVRQLQPVTPEIQSSIKEVTSAIVHYVNDQAQAQQQHQRSRSTSPNSRKCWLESSFVGIRPLDSPQTPVIESSPQSLSERVVPSVAHQSYAVYVDATNATTQQPPLRMNGLSRIGGGGANTAASRQQLEVLTAAEQQRLRRRSEGDAPAQKKQQQQQQQQQQQTASATIQSGEGEATTSGRGVEGGNGANWAHQQKLQSTAGHTAATRRVSLGDSSESPNNNKTNSTELQIRCRNTKCDQSATPADAKKFYKSCHNCTHLYCSRECRRAHWEKHRKACLHSRASNLCRQVLATCKDDVDSQRHLSLLARKGSLSQGRGVVRVLFRSAEAAEGFIKHGFQCMGEASYVRWPDLMPAEMGLELYSELLKLSTAYKPESKMLIYVAICVVSEAPGMGQAPVRWERQLVSRCAKLKLCKSILAELDQQQQALQQPLSVVAVPERTDILILTFNPSLRSVPGNRELILSNILDILSRRGVLLRKHYPEIYQRLQSYTEGQTDKFNPVTLHPRDSQTGQSFVCIIMPVHTDSEFVKLPSAADGGNRVTTIDVGSPAALAQLDDDELLTRTTQEQS